MSTVTFTNPGLIPIEGITTMGINVKDGETPIGFFGTGLKYAIAGILRTGQKITIWRGLERYDFSSQKDLVRGKEFNFICMSEAPADPFRLGFTTEFGKTWEMWQIFRELYSNCLDESGTMWLRPAQPCEDWTTIQVTGEAFFGAAVEKNKIFLSSIPIFLDEDCEIHEGSTNNIYYRGIKVGELEKPTAFTYNILEKRALTEDRTLRYTYDLNMVFTRSIMQSKNKDILTKTCTNKDCYEYSENWSSCCNQSSAEIIMELATRRGRNDVSQWALNRAESWMEEKAPVVKAIVTPYELRQINKACDFLLRIGFDVTQEIIVATNLGSGIAGQARDEKIYLAKSTLDKGGNWLIGTILEEHLHIDRGFSDESREFQNFLLDLAIKFARQTLEEEHENL